MDLDSSESDSEDDKEVFQECKKAKLLQKNPILQEKIKEATSNYIRGNYGKSREICIDIITKENSDIIEVYDILINCLGNNNKKI